jgi:predicted NBD/HSP70 family sugar kinase
MNLYRAVLREDTVSRNDLANTLGLSLPTVAQNIKELLDKGLVREIGTMASTGGRKAAVLAPLVNARLSVGVDITRNHVSLAAVNLKGEPRATRRTQLKFVNSPGYYASVAELIKIFIQTHDISQDDLIGLGVSLPGIVSEDGTTLLNSHMLNVRDPHNIPLKIEKELPIRLFNDASAACLAELWEAGEGDFFFLSLSNSVGGSLVIDGKIFYGDNQRCGEAGHMSVDPKGLPCYCGKLGHYDSYGSALKLADPAGGRLENFFEALEGGNQDFKKIFDDYLDMLSFMVCNLRMCFDSDIVLGGYVGGFLGPYLDDLKKRVAKLDSFQDNADYLRLCRFKMEGAAVGAALHFIDLFIDGV